MNIMNYKLRIGPTFSIIHFVKTIAYIVYAGGVFSRDISVCKILQSESWKSILPKFLIERFNKMKFN
jgi:hypothetical protein